MDNRTKKGNIPMLICFLLAFVILMVLYFLWNTEPAPGERAEITTLVARTSFPPLMCVFGTAWVFYALEWGGVVRVRRSLAGGITVAVIILIVWSLIILSFHEVAFTSRGEAINAREHPRLLGIVYTIYLFGFNHYIGMLISQVMGFGLFWAIGKKQKT